QMFANFKQKIAEFMRGRYGIDHLYVANLILYFILLIIQRWQMIPYFDFLLFLLIIWTFYRVFSRNISKRQAENQVLLRFVSSIKSKSSLLFRRIKDIGTHRYRSCTNCKTTLRLPRNTDVHTVKCTRCNSRFEVKVRL